MNDESWRQDVDVLIDSDRLRDRIRELGTQITEDYAGERLTVLGILKGSFMFMADLVRQIDRPVNIQFMGISSYGDETESSGVVKITFDLTESIRDKHVLICEDIIDSGLTMQYLLENLATRHPKSIKVCSLLHKPDNARVKVPVDYVGFTIPNHFVIGYGLDLANLYRNLPFIGVYNGKA